MERKRSDLLLLAALVAGASYYAQHWLMLDGPLVIAWKGSGVALLALWARLRATSTDGRLIAAALGLGALGDVLLNAMGMNTGALAFLAGHALATIVYLRNPARSWLLAAPVAAAIAGAGWALTANVGVTAYAFGLGTMAGSAFASRFPLAALGAALFVVSDLLLFAEMRVLAHSPLPGLLIWPTYFAGQALIAWGVVTGLEKAKA